MNIAVDAYTRPVDVRVPVHPEDALPITLRSADGIPLGVTWRLVGGNRVGEPDAAHELTLPVNVR